MKTPVCHASAAATTAVLLTYICLMQDKAEAKLRTLEQRAQEQQKAHMAAEEEWRRQQRERELARLHVCCLLSQSCCMYSCRCQCQC